MSENNSQRTKNVVLIIIGLILWCVIVSGGIYFSKEYLDAAIEKVKLENSLKVNDLQERLEGLNEELKSLNREVEILNQGTEVLNLETGDLNEKIQTLNSDIGHIGNNVAVIDIAVDKSNDLQENIEIRLEELDRQLKELNKSIIN